MVKTETKTTEAEQGEKTKSEIIAELQDLRGAIVSEKYAKEILAEFGVLRLPEKLIKTPKQFLQQRAFSADDGISVPELCLFICQKLKVNPDVNLMRIASNYYGAGRKARTTTEACLKAISEKLSLPYEVKE